MFLTITLGLVFIPFKCNGLKLVGNVHAAILYGELWPEQVRLQLILSFCNS